MQEPRNSERGAVQIKTILIFALLAIAVFLVIKLAPVYLQQRTVTHDVEDLARISAVRGYNKDKINKGIQELLTKHELKEGEITLVEPLEAGKVRITIKYSIPVDLFFTEYNWDFDYLATGKEF